MSWKDNRRRNRSWYRHYRQLADELQDLVIRSSREEKPIAPEAILKMFFDLFERRRLHKRRRCADSAWASIELAVKDTKLDCVTLVPSIFKTPEARVPAIGQLGNPGEPPVATDSIPYSRNARPDVGVDVGDGRGIVEVWSAGGPTPEKKPVDPFADF